MTAGALLLLSGKPVVPPDPMFLMFFAGSIFGVFGLSMIFNKWWKK